MKKAESVSKTTAPAPVLEGARYFDAITREIRRPIEGMMAMTELLQRQPLTPDAESYVRTLNEHHQTLLRMLADTADLLRAETGQLEITAEAAELRPLMDSIQEEWATTPLHNVALSISYDGADLAAVIDSRRLRQVFSQLIKRAVSATRRGGVEAQLHARREGGAIVLRGRVRDSGKVLSADAREGFFEIGNEGADGVNMRLCRRLIEAMGGSITVDNNTGAGTTISFEYTAAEAEAAADNGLEDQIVARGAHILVVDDNATNRMVAEALCEMFDCTSESAEDGVEAVEAAKTGRFDLILMDIKMPRMDGIEATRIIRAMGGPASQVPIIALTANADPEDAMNYLASGMSSVVEKPIKPEALLAAMTACLPEPGETSSRSAAA